MNELKYLNEVPPSDNWFPNEYIDAEVKKKLDKIKRKLADDEMKKETKRYVKYINQDPKWLKKISIEIDKLIINSEYIDFFLQIYTQCRKYDGSTSSFQKLIVPRLPCLEKLALSQLKVHI